jgi:hypothetical protein
MDTEDFITTTINMPGLRDVFLHNKHKDYIFIKIELIEKYNFAIKRLQEILKQNNIKVWAEQQDFKFYKLYVEKA